MTCKCKREMIIYRIGADFNKPILFHYCTHCGRVFLYGIAKDLKGKWIESFKSVNEIESTLPSISTALGEISTSLPSHISVISSGFGAWNSSEKY